VRKRGDGRKRSAAKSIYCQSKILYCQKYHTVRERGDGRKRSAAKSSAAAADRGAMGHIALLRVV
jgi:hypothetical protein